MLVKMMRQFICAFVEVAISKLLFIENKCDAIWCLRDLFFKYLRNCFVSWVIRSRFVPRREQLFVFDAWKQRQMRNFLSGIVDDLLQQRRVMLQHPHDSCWVKQV